MSGPFYGSLAASASVFVAILTALLVNNYVEIKSDRRQTEKELNRVKEDLDGLKNRKGDYEDVIDPLIEKRESDYIEKAEEQVDEFLESEVPSEYLKPVESLTIEELYQDLIDFHNCESSEDLEDSPINLHHRDILEQQIDEIEGQVLEKIIPSFASKYEGEGWDPASDPDRMGLAEKIEKLAEAEEEEKDEQKPGGAEESDSVIEVGDLERDSLELDEFIEKYKEEYGLDSLNEKTLDWLKKQYNEVVDKPPSPERPSSGYSGLLDPETHSNISNSLGPFSQSNSLHQSVTEAAMAAEEAQSVSDPLGGIGFEVNDSALGLNSQEKRKLEDAQKDLRDIEIEIKTLEQRKGRLEREKEGLHPEDLVPTLTANVATILLSVVIPIFAYLLFTTKTTITVPSWAMIIAHTEVNVFLSWLLGLIVVFESIHARINDREPKAYSLYQWSKSYFPSY